MANEASTSGSSTLEPRSLEYTPTWALASVATAFLLISMGVERLLLFLAHYLRETNRKPLLAALQKMKDELMLMGFISLTITILQDPVSKLCVPSSVYNKWTPCAVSDRPGAPAPVSSQVPTGRRLLATESASVCQAGYEPFMTDETINQLHIFIVVLALVHVIYSCITMLCALFRVYRWRKWENEAHQAANETRMPDLIKNITLNRQSTFVRYHTSEPWSRSRFVVWLVCFFQQFYIPRADYLALRLSFINTHNLRDTYDFHSYMVRTMEDEFETIVGISAWQWGCVIVLWVLNVNGAQLYFWTALIPVVVVFVIGTKLQHVIATLALENMKVPGPLVALSLKPRDQLFWFNRPKLLLSVIHLILFDTAFEIATFTWHVWQFGYQTCLLESNKGYLWGRLIIGFFVILFTSYSTLPLYALVTQMGSNYKKAVLSKNVERVLLQWHKDAKHRVKAKSSESDRSGSVTPSSSSLILHFKSRLTRGSSLHPNSASFQSPVDNARMEEGSLGRAKERPTAENIWGRPMRQGPLLPGSLRAIPTIKNEKEEKTPATTASTTTSTPASSPASQTTSRPTSAPTSRPTSQTIGEVQFLPPHPAFNYSRSDAVLQRQSSAPNFEIQRDWS